jgi:hypothetical protein
VQAAAVSKMTTSKPSREGLVHGRGAMSTGFWSGAEGWTPMSIWPELFELFDGRRAVDVGRNEIGLLLEFPAKAQGQLAEVVVCPSPAGRPS